MHMGSAKILLKDPRPLGVPDIWTAAQMREGSSFGVLNLIEVVSCLRHTRSTEPGSELIWCKKMIK